MNWKVLTPPNVFTIVSSFCLGIFLNCAAFVHYENPNLKNTKTPELEEKKSVLIKYFGDYYENGKFSKHPQHIPILNERMVDIVKESNLFKNVVTKENEPYDYIIYVETNINEKGSKVWPALAGATFLVFPLIMDQDFSVKVSLLDSKRKLLAVNEERMNMDVFVGWVIIPISPFFFTPVVQNNAYRNVIYSSLSQWKSKGIIK
ncbi:MAG: hypothetical protein IBJ01_03080 [Leptospira sp.]|uniref:Lipoprotein n=1 Tax=Leptospira paudalimensis TaxID=2950024 RepID=A0ABT3M9V7_9LEPT|nr:MULTISPECIES: hypothetical protein [Leptospira]MBL0953729.1 hypothetical protein [Leptospira sp.]MCW7505153.1 hypothetical protein [Leptospira paudalimensis]